MIVELVLACSCARAYLPASPTNGATGVPLNVQLTMPAPLVTGTPLPTLEVLDGGQVPLAATPWGRLTRLRPMADLAPLTTYRVVSNVDQLTFTTGTSTDLTPPVLGSPVAIDLTKHAPVQTCSEAEMWTMKAAGSTDDATPADQLVYLGYASATPALGDDPSGVSRSAVNVGTDGQCERDTSLLAARDAWACLRVADWAGNVSESCDPVRIKGCGCSSASPVLVLAALALLTSASSRNAAARARARSRRK